MRVDLFDFNLPPERIALRPVCPRDAAKLLLVEPMGQLSDHKARDLPELLQAGDMLVLNDTKVIPAQLNGARLARDDNGSPAKISATLHQRLDQASWAAFIKPARKIRLGDRLKFEKNETHLFADVQSCGDNGEAHLRFSHTGEALDQMLAQVGHVPLPPYIASKRAEDGQDVVDYQTIYARHSGAVAAPTAGLHFTPDLFAALQDKGIKLCYVTLHVGAGTFLPVKAQDTKDHHMHSEYGVISASTAELLNQARAQGGRIVAVGTTSLRILESAADAQGKIQAFAGLTDIFITPGYDFKVVDVLMTNFHLPRSTLLMLISAFSGLETIQRAYKHAIDQNYRFYSYGDATLLFRS